MQKKDILLFFLAAPVSEKDKTKLDRIRIMKGLFLFKMEHTEPLDNFYEFIPYLYGPCSFEIYHDLDLLEKDKYIDKEQSEAKTSPFAYRITEKGEEKLNEVSGDISASAKQKLTEIKNQITKMSFLELLSYVYKKYPDFAIKSIVVMGDLE